MERADKDLAFLLRYENVAWFEDGEVRILDRRIYPAKVEFVTCRTHQEVARAITDMVTQSAGPYTAAPMGMALAAWECRGKSADEQMEYLKKAAYTISHARPTTQKRMTLLCDICLKEAERALSAGENVAEAIKNKTTELNNVRYNRMAKIGSYLVDMFPDNGTVMTHCFAETIVGTMLRECRSRGKNIRLFCPETRPYFQGARLTASVCRDMGFDVTVISDNMPAFVGLDKIVASRKDDTTLGFGGKVRLGKDEVDYSALEDVKPQDLTKFGLIPEFVGRLPIVVNLNPLDEEALVKILTEPKNAIIKQYQKLVGLDGVKLTVEDDAVREIAQTAIRLKTGARGLRTIIEGVMTGVMYKIPSEPNVEEVIVTKECITNGAEPILVYKKSA